MAFVVIAHPALERGIAARRRIGELGAIRVGRQRRLAEGERFHPPATGGMNTTVSPCFSGVCQSLNSEFSATFSCAGASWNGCRCRSSAYSSAGVAGAGIERLFAASGLLAQDRVVLNANGLARSCVGRSCLRGRSAAVAASNSSARVHVVQRRAFGQIEQRRVGIDQELARALLAGRDVREQRLARGGLPDRAQRFGQAVVRAAISRRDLVRIAVRDQMVQRRSVRNGRSHASTSHAAFGCSSSAAEMPAIGPMPG